MNDDADLAGDHRRLRLQPGGTLGYPGEPLWWDLASLVAIMLLGHWIEMRSISQASGAPRELARLLPSTAQRLAKVIAGTVNGAGSVRVEVTGTGERTALANIMRLVEQAQTSRSRAQALADRAAFLLTIVRSSRAPSRRHQRTIVATRPAITSAADASRRFGCWTDKNGDQRDSVYTLRCRLASSGLRSRSKHVNARRIHPARRRPTDAV